MQFKNLYFKIFIFLILIIQVFNMIKFIIDFIVFLYYEIFLI